MADLDKYTDLKKSFDYDKKKATRLAEALTEAIEVKKRLDYLQKISNDNLDLAPFMWTTAEGQVKALHDIETSHLEHIISHQTRNGRALSIHLIAEAEGRGIDVEKHVMPALRLNAVIEDDDEWRGQWDDL